MESLSVFFICFCICICIFVCISLLYLSFVFVFCICLLYLSFVFCLLYLSFVFVFCILYFVFVFADINGAVVSFAVGTGVQPILSGLTQLYLILRCILICIQPVLPSPIITNANWDEDDCPFSAEFVNGRDIRENPWKCFGVLAKFVVLKFDLCSTIHILHLLPREVVCTKMLFMLFVIRYQLI